MGKRIRPEVYLWGIAVALVVSGMVAWQLAGRFPWTWYHLLAGWLLSINLVTFVYYGHDKRQARVGGRRVPELLLQGMMLLGGTLGGYLGMRMFRHKTSKGGFRLVFWWIVSMQVLLVLAVLYRLATHQPS